MWVSRAIWAAVRYRVLNTARQLVQTGGFVCYLSLLLSCASLLVQPVPAPRRTRDHSVRFKHRLSDPNCARDSPVFSVPEVLGIARRCSGRGAYPGFWDAHVEARSRVSLASGCRFSFLGADEPQLRGLSQVFVLGRGCLPRLPGNSSPQRVSILCMTVGEPHATLRGRGRGNSSSRSRRRIQHQAHGRHRWPTVDRPLRYLPHCN